MSMVCVSKAAEIVGTWLVSGSLEAFPFFSPIAEKTFPALLSSRCAPCVWCPCPSRWLWPVSVPKNGDVVMSVVLS